MLPPTRRATRRRWARRRCARLRPPGWYAVRVRRPSTRRPRCCRPSAPRSWSPCCRCWSAPAPGRGCCSPSWPTRRTTSVPGWPARRPSPAPTSSRPTPPTWRWCGSTRPPTPPARCCSADHLRAVVEWGRTNGVLIVSDECYLDFGWDAEPVSLLHPAVCDGSYDGVLVVHSLSKRSNLAGYRGGFVAGDRSVIATLLEIRKHLGLMVPGPVQAAMTAALSDETHVERAARALPAPPHGAAPGARVGGLPHRPLARRALPVGHPRRAVHGDGRLARRARDPRRTRRFLRPSRCPARTGRAHRDRRAGRRRRGAPHRLTASFRTRDTPGHAESPAIWREPVEKPGLPCAVGDTPGHAKGRAIWREPVEN